MIATLEKPARVNPVYAAYFADPFVWRWEDQYYAIGTGAAEASGQTVGKIFPLLHSADFIQWHFASNALLRPDASVGTHFWAPEVAFRDGTFYLYYSVGHGDKDHQLRVAASNRIQGPYKDCGAPLLAPATCPFAIDAHPFKDDDGHWYLFYARDFLEVSSPARAGTGLMVARMQSATRLENEGRMVLRAHLDWQRFQSNRPMYGRSWDWHTLEGPCVRKHHGQYYCFYSGGRWDSENYGVDYGVADHVAGPYSDAGNEAGPRVLRTVRGRVIGPGHNSIVVGPDGKTEYLVYHAWDRTGQNRLMCMDKLVWASDGPRCEGPTWVE